MYQSGHSSRKATRWPFLLTQELCLGTSREQSQPQLGLLIHTDRRCTVPKFSKFPRFVVPRRQATPRSVYYHLLLYLIPRV